MFTEVIGKIDALRGQEKIEPHQLLDTLKDALGQCQAVLEQRGPVSVSVNGSGMELGAQAAYKLPQHQYPGASEQSDLSGYGGDFSFPPMFTPDLTSPINGFYQPTYGYPLMFPSGPNNQWNVQDVYAPLIVNNSFSYYQMPVNWVLGDDPRQGAVTNACAGFFTGVTIFSPIDIENNPTTNNVTIVNHGDTVTNNLYAEENTYVNNDVNVHNDVNVDHNVNIDNDLFVQNNVDIEGDVTIIGFIEVNDLTVVNIAIFEGAVTFESTVTFQGGINLTSITGYDGAADQVLTHQAGTLTWVDVEEC